MMSDEDSTVTGSDRTVMIRNRLEAALSIDDLSIVDDSAAHAGHEGARAGGGHFSVTVVSPDFDGKSLVERHRMVYDALGDAMESEIHALSIKALTPGEA